MRGSRYGAIHQAGKEQCKSAATAIAVIERRAAKPILSRKACRDLSLKRKKLELLVQLSYG